MPIGATYSVTEYVACYNRTVAKRGIRGIMTDSKNYQALVPSIKLPNDILSNLAAVSDIAKSAAEQVNMRLQPSQDVIDKLTTLVEPTLNYCNALGKTINRPLVKPLDGYSIVNLEDMAIRTEMDFPNYALPDMGISEQEPVTLTINIDPRTLCTIS